MYPSRTMCAVLEDMRKCYKTYNFIAVSSLIEEAQMLANRMEAHIDTACSYNDLRDKLRETRNQLDKLKNEVKLYEEIKEKK